MLDSHKSMVMFLLFSQVISSLGFFFFAAQPQCPHNTLVFMGRDGLGKREERRRRRKKEGCVCAFFAALLCSPPPSGAEKGKKKEGK